MLGIERGGLVSVVVALGLCFSACGGGNTGDDDSTGGESGESGSKPSGGAAGKGSSGQGGTGGGTTGGTGGGASGGRGGTGGSLPMLAGRSGGGAAATGGASGGSSGGTGGGSSGDAGEAGDTSSPGAGGTGGSGGTGGTGGEAGDGGTGGSPFGGSSGSAGAAGKAGMGGSGGAPPIGSALGMPCTEDTDCAEGLSCFQADDEIGFGPPGGTCTASCEDDTDCDDFVSDAICVDAGAKGLVCMLGCTAGEAATKCYGRLDAVCGIGYLLVGSEECELHTDCTSGELCSVDGYCGEPVAGCLPWCRGDFDCESSQFCETASGYCVASAPVGTDYGELCNPAASTDECAGTCFPSGTGSDGVCSSYCAFTSDSTGCGWDGTGPADSGCLFGTLLTDLPQVGDLGVCGKLCDCNDDCTAEGTYCGADFTDFISDTWGHQGYCRALLEDEVVGDTIACEG